MRETMAALVETLINGVLNNSGLGWFIWPFITIFAIIRFLRWALSQSRGTPDIDDIQGTVSQYQQRAQSAPDRAQRAFRRRY